MSDARWISAERTSDARWISAERTSDAGDTAERMSDALGPETSAVAAPAAFVVRATRDAAGRVTGVVERVATGEKVRFAGVAAMAEIIERMVPGPPVR